MISDESFCILARRIGGLLTLKDERNSYLVFKSILCTEKNVVLGNREVVIKNTKTLVGAAIFLIYAVANCLFIYFQNYLQSSQ